MACVSIWVFSCSEETVPESVTVPLLADTCTFFPAVAVLLVCSMPNALRTWSVNAWSVDDEVEVACEVFAPLAGDGVLLPGVTVVALAPLDCELALPDWLCTLLLALPAASRIRSEADCTA